MFTKENLWFLVRWIFLTMFGYFLGILIIFIPVVFISVMGDTVVGGPGVGVLSGILAGVFISFFQSLIIKKKFINGEDWFPTSLVGWGVLLSILYSVENNLMGEKGFEFIIFITLLIGVLGVLLISLYQWKVFLSRNYLRSWIWIPASVFGMGIGLVLGYFILGEGLIYPEMKGIIFGPTYTLFTGLALIYLFQPKFKIVNKKNN